MNLTVSLEDCAMTTAVLDEVLEAGVPPVARCRLLSAGLSSAQAVDERLAAGGQKGCLACGNCVDACPVFLKMKGRAALPSQRTSMYLETVVGSSCLRCYMCIRACPQVSKAVKDYAARYRLAEKVVHWWHAGAYVLLFLTGFVMYHFRPELGPQFRLILGVLHRTFAVCLGLGPLVLLLWDARGFRRGIRDALTWGREDREWVFARAALARMLKPCGYTGALNPWEKTWYLVVLGGLVVFGVTGVSKWIGTRLLPDWLVASCHTAHVVMAWVTDILLVTHIWLKVVARALHRFRFMLEAVVRLKGLWEEASF